MTIPIRRKKSFDDYLRLAEETVIKSAALLVSLMSVVGIVAAKLGFSTDVFEESKVLTMQALVAMLTAIVAALVIGSQSRHIAAVMRRMSGPTKVFISYPASHLDIAVEISERLRHEGVKVWLGADNIQSGDQFISSIEQGFTSSDSFVFILSSTMSEESRRELDIAVKKKLRMIPVIAEEVVAMPQELSGIGAVNLLQGRQDGIQQIIQAVA